MPTVDESIVIDRPPGEVFSFASDPVNLPRYSANVVEYEQVTDGPRGEGTRDRGVIKVAGKKLDFAQVVTEWREGECATMRSVEAPMGMEWTIAYRFDEEGDTRTRVTFHQEASLGSVFGKLGEKMVVKKYARDTRASLEKLKELLES